MISRYKPDTTLTFVNDAYCKFFGKTCEEFVGQSFLEWVAPEFHESVRNETEEMVKNPKLKSGEFLNYRYDGKECWFQWIIQGIKDESGKVAEIQAVGRDITELKQTEAALRDSEKNYRELIDGMNEIVWVIDLDCNLIDVNKTAVDVLGYSKEELFNIGIFGVDASLKKEEIKALAKAIQAKQTQIFETTHKAKDGKIIPIELYSSLITYQGREAILGIARDITARKRSEAALLENEAKYRTLVTQSPDGIFIVDLYGTFLSVNKAICDILKYSEEELLSKMIWDIVPQKYLSLQKTRLAALLKGESKKDAAEYEVIGKDGNLHFVEVLSTPYYKGKEIIGFQGIARDITEQKKTESKLRENEQFFRLLFTTSPDSILIFDPFSTTVPWEILDCNDVACKINGYTRDELIGKSVDMLNTKVLTPEERAAHIKRLQEKGVAYFETLHRHRDGHIFPIDVASSIVTLGGRQVVLGIDRDVTERKRSEEALRQAQKLEGLGTLAGGIAHDFNNILAIILAYNTGIKRFRDDPKKMDLATDTITKAVERGKTIVQQILTFARKTGTAFEAVNVNEVVMEIMTMICETFPKTLTHTQNLEKGMPFINADRSQLYQAILNLCVNARDVMQEGGILAINTRIVPCNNLRAQHPDVTDNNYICIEVSDTGEGMDQEIRKRIFEPFFTTKEIGKGTGLGLAVVFGIVQTHQGFIDVESEVGQGTIFKLYLPVSKTAEPVTVKETENIEDISGGTETLLVVEDEDMLLMSLQMILFEKGYNILTAKDGLEALKVYQENKDDIALVLTDLGLPTITGLEVCQQIKKINSDIRVILATGYLDPEMKSEFLKAGIRNFLFKPYDLRKVLKVIREVLDEK